MIYSVSFQLKGFSFEFNYLDESEYENAQYWAFSLVDKGVCKYKLCAAATPGWRVHEFDFGDDCILYLCAFGERSEPSDNEPEARR